MAGKIAAPVLSPQNRLHREAGCLWSPTAPWGTGDAWHTGGLGPWCWVKDECKMWAEVTWGTSWHGSQCLESACLDGCH